MKVVGVDIGGTFTDLVSFDDDGLVCAKASTTPDSPTEGVAACLELAGCAPSSVRELLHGSTIAINTVLERKGTATALITTRGFADVYAIGRSNRPESFNLDFRRPKPLVPRALRLEASERIDAAGRVLAPLDEAEIEAFGETLVARGVRGIAVCLLHAYRNPAHERQAAAVLRRRFPEVFVTASHEILREIREYERTSTTVLNAYVGPRVSAYLGRLDAYLQGGGFAGALQIMRSNGGAMTVGQAREQPVWMMESGPVAGMIGAAELARLLGLGQCVGFDMGGTTAKSAFIEDGVPLFRNGYHIGGEASGQPMQLPVVDVIEIGAGGGSLARVDAQGALRVGPESAGAEPGPACYRRGGDRPTVTDANLLLGRLNPRRFLGGGMDLDTGLAERAMRAAVGEPLGLGARAAAQGVVRIADTMMSLSVRAVSVERGIDPRRCAMIAFGGAGPLHALAIAKEIKIPRVVVPRYPGTFSALGMLLAAWRQDFVQTRVAPLESVDPDEIARQFEEIAAPGWAQMEADGFDETAVVLAHAVDLRYRGQDHALTVPVEGGARLDAATRERLRLAFDALHERQYGHASPGEAVEIVNLRLSMTLPREASLVERLLAAPYAAEGGPADTGTRPVVLDDPERPVETRIVWRPALAPGAVIDGPAVIEEENSTTLLHPGDAARITEAGTMIVEVAL